MGGTYYVDCSDLDKLADKMLLFPKQSTQAMSKSLNKTLNRVASTTRKEVLKDYSPLLRGVNDVLVKKRANYSRLQAEAIYTDSQLKASGFSKSLIKTGNRSPVKVKIKKRFVTSGSNPVMFSGRGSEIFKRPLGSRDVRTVYTVSIPQMVSNDEVYARIAKDAGIYLSKTFAHELEWRISQLMD